MREPFLVFSLTLALACGSSSEPPAQSPRSDSPAVVHVVAPERAPRPDENTTPPEVVEPGGNGAAVTPAPSPPPSADSSAAASAEAAFREARSLMEAGRHAEACPKLEESLRFQPALGTVLNLARCYELLGNTVAACTRYQEAESMANGNGQPERARFAHDQRAKLGCR